MSKPVLAKVTLGKFCIVGQTVEHMDEGDPGFGDTQDIILKNSEGRLVGVDQTTFDKSFTYDLHADVLPPKLAVTGPNDVPDEDEDSGVSEVSNEPEEDNEPVLEEDVPPIEEPEAQL